MRNYFKSLPLVALAAVAIGGLTLAVAAGEARATACQPNAARCQTDSYSPVTPTFSVGCENVVLQTSGVDYNVPQRSLEVRSDEAQGAELWLNDDFTVTGPPVGSLVTLHLRMRVHGTLGGLGEPTGSHAVIDASPLAPQPGDPPKASKSFDSPPALSGVVAFADSVDLVITRTVGTSFGLQIHALADVGGYDTVLDGQFAFIGLTPGANVSSCKGYSQDQPVPALARSWGSVKATYR